MAAKSPTGPFGLPSLNVRKVFGSHTYVWLLFFRSNVTTMKCISSKALRFIGHFLANYIMIVQFLQYFYSPKNFIQQQQHLFALLFT